LACAVAHAQFASGFEAGEGYTGSAEGTVLTGQQGWVLPPSSLDYKVYTYNGNTLGIAPNPQGSDQFTAGVSNGTTYGRAQHAFNWGASDLWTVTYDINPKFNGSLPAADNLGSFSQQPSATNMYWQSIFQYEDPNAATEWKTGYGTQEHQNPNFLFPGDAWRRLALNHWYRQSLTFRFSDKLILEIKITDLTTGITNTANPNEHLITMNGQLPTDFRFFTGGSNGNVTAWDNLTIEIPEPSTFALMALALAGLATRRR
jgi:hypothetical protein